MQKQIGLILVSAVLLSSCAEHRLVVQRPNPDGEQSIVHSNAFLLPRGQPRNVAQCQTNLIDEVRVKTNFGQSLVSVLTLGFYQPTTIEYYCAKIPSDEGSTDE
ncbi:Bor family protein [Parasphingorhabdus litoris]|uniref:Bor family protein n=1 Tax=Parasphingorhabdus litoris TaxID=394733 RepID=UPI001E2AE707|nr:Bor family protein [Parasphingorhabdus litoris]